MTDLVPFTPSWVDIVTPSVQLAERIARTEFVPKGLQGRPEAVLAAILTGHEVGIGPMTALAKIAVVDGRPTMAAELLRALGLAAGHDMWIEEATNTRVVAAGRRRGSEHVTKVTWTMDDARKANIAGKANWTRYPRAMLLARATAELARLVWPDALGGISYATEELDESPAETPAVPSAAGNGEPATPDPGTRRRRPRATPEAAPAPAPAPAPITHPVQSALPPLPGEPGYDAPAEPEPEPWPYLPPLITDPQRRKLQAAMRDAGFVDREARIDLCTAIVGRRITSSNDLTIDEASKLIDALEDVAAGRAEVDVDDRDLRPVGIRRVPPENGV